MLMEAKSTSVRVNGGFATENPRIRSDQVSGHSRDGNEFQLYPIVHVNRTPKHTPRLQLWLCCSSSTLTMKTSLLFIVIALAATLTIAAESNVLDLTSPGALDAALAEKGDMFLEL